MKEYEQKINNIINNAKEDVIYQAHQAYQNGYEDGYVAGYAHGKQDGYENGKAATPFTETEEAEEKAYTRGLNAAWEAAKWLYNNPVNLGEDIFNCDFWEIYSKYTAQEVVHKIKEYEDTQKQDAEIKVGDEVDHDGLKSIVVRISNDYVYTVTEIGTTPTYHYTGTELIKTGRHFPQIVEVLKEIRGESE